MHLILLVSIFEQGFDILFSTGSGIHEWSDARKIRKLAFSYRIPCHTTIPSASITIKTVETRRNAYPALYCLQDIHSG